ncbi:MAG: zf-HC2 domain-containing protein [Melioribacter sp.]|nr:zf-HC2 domain-containing protein [Melioribacter sp.]
MNCEEVKIGLHDFVDELSDNFMKREIEIHLRTCDKCFNEYKKLKNFFDKLKDLTSTIEPPDGIIQAFSSKLLERSIKEDLKEKIISDPEKIKQEQIHLEKSIMESSGALRKSILSMALTTADVSKAMPSASRINWSRVILILLPFVLLATAYLVYDLQKNNSPWKIKSSEGRILINGKENNIGPISEGESLLSSDSSKTEILIPRIGSIVVYQNSIMILKKAKDGDNRITLEKGLVKIKNVSQEPDFAVDLKNGSVIDRGGEFTVYVDEFENAKISVDLDFTEILKDNESYFLSEKYSCDIINGNKPGTPYRSDAPDTLIKEIKNFDYNNGRDYSINNIIATAQRQDMLTLLAIIPQVSQAKRETLFQTITNHFPPPENVTRMDILKADKKMLQIWWEEIRKQLKSISDRK